MCLEPDLKEGSHIRGKTPGKTSGNLVQLRSVEELDAGPPAGVTTDRPGKFTEHNTEMWSVL